MAIINLRDYYPFYTSDCFMEVSDEVAEMFKEFDRKEAAYERQNTSGQGGPRFGQALMQIEN